MKYIRKFIDLFKRPLVFDKKYLPEGWSVYDCVKFYQEYGCIYIDSRDNKDVEKQTTKTSNRHHRHKSKSDKNE